MNVVRRGWGQGLGQRGMAVVGGSDKIEGAKRPFGCERSEPSCSGLGSAECSAAECGPTSSFAINRLTSLQDGLEERDIFSNQGFVPCGSRIF